jgi:threonine dehydratase
MPADAPALKIENTRAMGAEVVLYDRAGGRGPQRHRRALRDERGLTLIKPFDEPQVIAGQGTCGLEIAEQAAEAGVTEADGAGLLRRRRAHLGHRAGAGGEGAGDARAAGGARGLRRHRPLARSGRRSLRNDRAGGGVLRRDPDARARGEITFPVMARLCGPGLVVSEAETRAAMRLAFERLKVVAEPGGAVALAAALFHGRSWARARDRHDLGRQRGPALFAEVLVEG